MAYWDTSCLVKLYAWEPDSAAIRGLAVSGDVVVTSAIARFELWATLSRKEATGDLETNGARQAIAASLRNLFSSDSGSVISAP